MSGVDEATLAASAHRRLVDECAFADAAPSPVELRQRLVELVREEAPLLAPARLRSIVDALMRDVTGLGPIEPLLDDPDVTEVMLNGPGRSWIERHGRLEAVAVDLDAAAIGRIVERIIAPLGLRCDRSAPVVDARLPDGSRLHAVLPPVAIDGPYVNIRRFRSVGVGLDAFSDDARLHTLLRWAVHVGWNLLISGGTSSGKTTLLNALSASLPADDRIVTIEETAELALAQPHVVRLEARHPNAEGAGAVSVRDLVRASLRMRPQRIVIGEVRGAEALDLIEALNTGHDGSLSTIHANGPAEALLRLETLAMRGGDLPPSAVRAHVSSSIDAVIQVVRDPDGARRAAAVAEVTGDPPELSTRSLWTAHAGLIATPSRPARRFDAPAFGATA